MQVDLMTLNVLQMQLDNLGMLSMLLFGFSLGLWTGLLTTYTYSASLISHKSLRQTFST